MPQYITTPYAHPSQLLQVRSALYPPSHTTSGSRKSREEEEVEQVEAIRLAVARVGVWVHRGNCPHLVESTAILRAAELNDGQVGGEGLRDRWCVRAAYGAAFSRFVTGLLDSHQNSRTKRSMYSIAKTLGLPATYVELRHQATHEELPSLAKLRTATSKALKWIWDFYWVHLEDDADEVTNGEGCRELLRRWVNEINLELRSALEEKLNNWKEEELMRVLMDEYDISQDVPTKLRIVRLQSQILCKADKAAKKAKLQPLKSIEDMKMELEEIGAELNRAENEPAVQSVPKDDEVIMTDDNHDDDAKGWKMWEGPWVPKPIGVV